MIRTRISNDNLKKFFFIDNRPHEQVIMSNRLNKSLMMIKNLHSFQLKIMSSHMSYQKYSLSSYSFLQSSLLQSLKYSKQCLVLMPKNILIFVLKLQKDLGKTSSQSRGLFKNFDLTILFEEFPMIEHKLQFRLLYLGFTNQNKSLLLFNDSFDSL